MSVAISSNTPGKEEAVCFISEGEEGDLVKKLLDYLEKLTKFYLKNSVMFLKPWSKIQMVEKKILQKNLTTFSRINCFGL